MVVYQRGLSWQGAARRSFAGRKPLRLYTVKYEPSHLKLEPDADVGKAVERRDERERVSEGARERQRVRWWTGDTRKAEGI
ncbi:hypothetical protein Trydic_g7062 [Trypoxylus dichotomus]